jgi:hypothetical protein
VTIADADVETEVAKARERYATDRKTVTYFESERGRSFIRSTLRRSRVVEKVIDEWLAAHPEQGPLPHLEDDEPTHGETTVESGGTAAATANVGATDPGSLVESGR